MSGTCNHTLNIHVKTKLELTIEEEKVRQLLKADMNS